MKAVTITGIAGAQQAATAAAFAAAGWQVTGTARSAKAGARMTADLETGEGLAAAFDGRDAVVFTLPQDHRAGSMLRMAKAVAGAASAAGVGRLIVNLAGRADPRGKGPFFDDLRAVRDCALSAAVPAVVLEPTVYMDNLLAPWSLPGILAGTLAYPAAAQVRLAWLSHASLAQAVVAAAAADVTGRSLRLGGPEALSGLDLTAALSARLGRPMAYARIPLDSFAAGLNAAFGAPAGDRIAELYALLDSHPEAMADAPDMAVLGVAAEPFAAFAARQTWA